MWNKPPAHITRKVTNFFLNSRFIKVTIIYLLFHTYKFPLYKLKWLFRSTVTYKEATNGIGQIATIKCNDGFEFIGM